MKYGIPAPDLPAHYPFAEEINRAGNETGVSPCLLGAIAYVETLCELAPGLATNCTSEDGGRGIFQLTASYPTDWEDPSVAAVYAAKNYVIPATTYWYAAMAMEGDALLRCIFAEYNGGRTLAIDGHNEGDVGKYTTHSQGVSYPDRALAAFHTLSKSSLPPLPQDE